MRCAPTGLKYVEGGRWDGVETTVEFSFEGDGRGDDLDILAGFYGDEAAVKLAYEDDIEADDLLEQDLDEILERSRRTAHILSFFVAGQERRGFGIGGLMIECAIEKLSSRGVEAVLLVASPIDAKVTTRKEIAPRLISFYERHGFHRIGKRYDLHQPMARIL